MLINEYHNLINKGKRYLWVNQKNEIAKKFYMKNGYDYDIYQSIVMIRKGVQ